MTTFQVAFVFSIILLEICSINAINPPKNQSKYIIVSILEAPPRPSNKLFGFENDMKKWLKQRESIEKKEIERKNKAILKEEVERRRIFTQRLLAYQGGSNVLRDFYTNRFL